jgi:hypothetical protein
MNRPTMTLRTVYFAAVTQIPAYDLERMIEEDLEQNDEAQEKLKILKPAKIPDRGKKTLLGGELNPGLPRTISSDRRKY